MPLVDALPYLPELPLGNSTNSTLPIPVFGDIPAPFDILALLTFSQTTITLLSSFYIAWQNFTTQMRANCQHGLDLVATLNKRTDSLLNIEKQEREPTLRAEALVNTYQGIIFQIERMNNGLFWRRWIMGTQIASRLRELAAEAEKEYELYLIKVNVAIFADAHYARKGVDDLQEKLDRVLELLCAKSSF